MSKNAHDYPAIVQQDKKSKSANRVTGPQVVNDNLHHWIGFADAGATFRLAVETVAGDYPDDHVNSRTVARAFLSIHGGWKEFCKKNSRSIASAPRLAALSVTPASAGDPIPMPRAAETMPVLNDERPTGGMTFGGAA